MAFQRDVCYLALMNQWFIRHQRNRPITFFFEHRNVKKIAVYGMGLYGRHLVRDLADSCVDVFYGIDRKKLPPYEGIPIYSLNENFPSVDAVVYSVLEGTDDIRKLLNTKFDCPIYSIEEVVFSYDG